MARDTRLVAFVAVHEYTLAISTLLLDAAIASLGRGGNEAPILLKDALRSTNRTGPGVARSEKIQEGLLGA